MSSRPAAALALIALAAAPACRKDGRPHPRLPIKVEPQGARLGVGERLLLKASRLGAKDPGLVWDMVEPEGGVVLSGGVYLAPQRPGTYHVRARDLRSGVVGEAEVTVDLATQVPLGTRTAELYPVGGGRSLPTGPLVHGRLEHGAGLLRDGRVLVVGGREVPGGRALASAEIWEPGTGVFHPLLARGLARIRPTVTALPKGQALILGGGSGDAELFDPVEERFLPAGHSMVAEGPHQTLAIGTDQVLVAGDRGLELYLAQEGRFRLLAGPGGYGEATLVLLDASRILIAGGTGPSADLVLVDLLAGTLTPLGSLPRPRARSAGLLLQDGRLLLAGGSEPGLDLVDTRTLKPLPPLESALGLPDGPVLKVGEHGLWALGARDGAAATAEAFRLQPWDLTVHPVLPLLQPRVGHTLTPLRDGRVLVVGGWDGATAPLPRRRRGASL